MQKFEFLRQPLMEFYQRWREQEKKKKINYQKQWPPKLLRWRMQHAQTTNNAKYYGHYVYACSQGQLCSDQLHPVSRLNAQSEETDDWKFVNPLDCILLCMNRITVDAHIIFF